MLQNAELLSCSKSKVKQSVRTIDCAESHFLKKIFIGV